MNLFENDTILIKSKRQAAEHIIERYGDFGWTLTERKDDKVYENIVHLTFSRPHFLENKDELQLLQVKLEIAYNTMGRLSSKIPVRATLAGIFSGLLALGLAVGGVLLILFLEGLLSTVLGAILCAVAVAVVIFCVILARTFHKRDKEKYSRLIEGQVQKIDELCKRARSLRGEDE